MKITIKIHDLTICIEGVNSKDISVNTEDDIFTVQDWMALGFSLRAANIFNSAKIRDSHQLLSMPDFELKHIRNLGPKSLKEIKEYRNRIQ